MAKNIIKKYPSRVKYEKKNPAITLRIPLEFKIKIDKMAETTGKSISQIVYEILSNAEKNFSTAFKKLEKDNFDKGYLKGQKDWAIWYYCKICKKIMYIIPNATDHKALIEYIEEQGWGHKECHDRINDIKKDQ
jgi:hypothetical protein